MAEQTRSPETRARIAAGVKRSIPTRKARWETLFWKAIREEDMETAGAILADVIRRKLGETA